MEITKMSVCKLLFLVVLSSFLLCCHTSSAGPAHQLARLAARASKIPRSIRAPFRNSEMMTARGFGKRRVPIGANLGGSSISSSSAMEAAAGAGGGGGGNGGVKRIVDDAPWAYDKQQTGKLIDELAGDSSDPVQQMVGEQESFPLEWFASEMSSNPALARTVLQRFVDSNRDGLLTPTELLSSSSASSGSSSDSNDLF